MMMMSNSGSELEAQAVVTDGCVLPGLDLANPVLILLLFIIFIGYCTFKAHCVFLPLIQALQIHGSSFISLQKQHNQANPVIHLRFFFPIYWAECVPHLHNEQARVQASLTVKFLTAIIRLEY